MRKSYVVGVGMTKFEKPGQRDWDYPDMGRIAGRRALEDAGLSYDDIEQAAVGWVYGESTSGERALYELGMTGIPIYNVNNNCSTGSTALFLARQLVAGGIADCVMAMGFEKMEKGSPGAKYNDRAHPAGRHFEAMATKHGFAQAPAASQLFGNAATEHMERYGSRPEHYAMIAEKNHRHSANNPYAQFQDVYSLEEIQASREVFGVLTKLQCCPTSEGAGAAIVCSEKFVHERGLDSRAIEIAGMAMATDFPTTFEGSTIKLVGYDMAAAAGEQAFAEAGVRVGDVDVVELHDCFSANELITYEALGLCDEGKGGELIESGNATYGGKYVVNPSGGLISKGHPLGATGLAQCAELVWQLRGEAGTRQVEGAELALQHNLGIGGACVVAVYRGPG